ncbi:MAG TPA: hypothetical protein VF753_09285 [Terriglobales bacterium]
MFRKFSYAAAIALFALALPCLAHAQSDENTMSLADVARAARAKRMAADNAVIDNDNLETVVEQAASHHKPDSLAFTIEQSGKKFDVVSPDATCSLSFNANAAALINAPVTPTELPAADLAKVDGPATFDGGVLEINLHNGSGWDLREIVVALTIVQSETTDSADSPRLVAALQQIPFEQAPVIVEKNAETTRIVHLKGTALPAGTAVFRQKLGVFLTPDQDWHWSILEAKGIPNVPAPSAGDNSAGN